MWKSVRVQLTFMGTTVGREAKVQVKVHGEGMSPGCGSWRGSAQSHQSHSRSQTSLSPSHTKQVTDSARSSRDIGLTSLLCILRYLALLPQDSGDEMSFQGKTSPTEMQKALFYVSIF